MGIYKKEFYTFFLLPLSVRIYSENRIKNDALWLALNFKKTVSDNIHIHSMKEIRSNEIKFSRIEFIYI